MKTNRATQTRRSPFEAQVAFARATTALRGVGFGALAVGAVGAVAIGALAIRKLVIKRGRIERLDIGELDVGRLPNAAHESRPWRIREIASDFTLEDVWALPANGGAQDFRTLLELMTSGLTDPADWESLPTRVLWRVRDRLGGWFGRCRTTCATPRRMCISTPCLSCPSIAPTWSLPRRCRTEPCTPWGTWLGSIRAKAATKDRWPSTSSHAVCSGRGTWRSSSRSGIGLFTQHSCDRSNASGIHAFLGRPRSA